MSINSIFTISTSLDRKKIADELMTFFMGHCVAQFHAFNLAGESAYKKDEESGAFPHIYLIDHRGNSLGNPLPDNDSRITRELIRKNGYIPEPSTIEIVQMTWDVYTYSLFQPGPLLDEQQRQKHDVARQIHNSSEQQEAYRRAFDMTKEKMGDSPIVKRTMRP